MSIVVLCNKIDVMSRTYLETDLVPKELDLLLLKSSKTCLFVLRKKSPVIDSIYLHLLKPSI